MRVISAGNGDSCRYFSNINYTSSDQGIIVPNIFSYLHLILYTTEITPNHLIYQQLADIQK